MAEIFKLGDSVWAKMKGFPYWPGRIAEPPSSMQTKKTPVKKSTCVFFFGTLNYGWVEDNLITSYEPGTRCKLEKKIPTSVSYLKAVKEIEAYIKHREENPDFDPDKNSEVFDQLKDDEEEAVEDVTPKKPKKRKMELDQKRKSAIFDKLKEDDFSTEKNPKKMRKTPAKRVSTTKDLTSNKKSRLSSDVIVANNGDSPHHSSNRMKNFDEILNRPFAYDLPDLPKVNLDKIPESLAKKDIIPSDKAFGFIGLGIMGSGIVKNLVFSGHHVNIWSRNIQKAEEFKSRAEINHPGQVEVYAAPSDIVLHSDIIFCCISDPTAVKEIITENCGIIDRIESLDGKGYVEMTNVDSYSSNSICNIITGKGGRYLEAQMQGSKQEAEEGDLIILGAGDKTLFDECETCFLAIAKTIFYLGEVGFASKMNLVLQVMKAVSLIGLAEGLALADRSGVSPKDVLEIFSLTDFCSPYLKNKAESILNLNMQDVQQPLQYMQKDLRHAINLGDNLNQPLFMASTANEIFKHARRLGYDRHDSSFVYMRTRH